ncbi:nuclear receptor ROR-alpha-like [Pecten maximus]|uniref:nuclear receptor ROR-alpha-like n=1 Tax=Pecten maximus TaxID=6579 RepID=UPI001459132D|nr:nuclear receptor ROR-alpha-like [Pecten maximus]
METGTCLYMYQSQSDVESPTLTVSSGSPTGDVLTCKDIHMNYNETFSEMKTTYTEKLGVSCQICGSMSSGFHYGAYTCEGCKAFFHRCTKKNIIFQKCAKGKSCRSNNGSKYKCRLCRYQKCVQVGMSIGAIRVGRMPNTEREKLRANRTDTIGYKRRLLDISNIITTNFTKIFFKSSIFESFSIGNAVDEDYSGFVISKLDSFGFHQLGVITIYHEMLVPMIKDTIKFAKKLPGFLDLRLSDRVVLMKEGALCVCILMMYGSFVGPHVRLNGKTANLYLTHEAIGKCSETQILFGKIIQISERIHQLNLHKTELALFASMILLSDNKLLEERDRIRSIAEDVTQAIQMEFGHIRSEDRDIHLSLLALKDDLKQTSMEFITNLKNGYYSFPEEECEEHLLLKEIFDI